MMNQENWFSFIRGRAKELFLLFLLICGGSLYAAYVVKKGSISPEMTDQYFRYKPDKLEGWGVLLCFWKCTKKLLLIWGISLVRWLIPLSLFFIGVYIFAYSFSIAVFLATMGIRDNLAVLIGLIIQSVIMIGYFLELFEFLLPIFLEKGQADRQKAVLVAVKGLCICAAVTAIQLGIYYII